MEPSLTWLVLRLDADHLPFKPPAAWVTLPLTRETRDYLAQLQHASPSTTLAAVMADWHRERDQLRAAQAVTLLAQARTISWDGAPEGLSFLPLLDPAGRHPPEDVADGVLVRPARHLPELSAGSPVTYASTHVDRGARCWFNVATRGGRCFETVSFDLYRLSS